MTQNKRIFLNIIATYGRSIFSILCGMFSVRWTLEALGHRDYGLFGVIGGLVLFVEFLNVQFGGAVSRFYAVAIGQKLVVEDKKKALENCREWFSTALSVHLMLPLLLIVIGYPIGIKAITCGWISVPVERFDACIWIWRFACLNVLTAMLSAPVWAMYIARQNIAELTIYGVSQPITW